jgi:hypothetical protein
MHIIFTVCNRFTFANAMALAQSVLHHEATSTFYLCWTDRAPLPALPAHVQGLRVEDIAVPGWQEMCSNYYDFELVAATRPWFAKYLIQLEGLTGLTFLAPSTWLMHAMSPVLTPQADLYLTPNISKPVADNPVIDDKRILNIGMFNSGAWSLRKNQSTESFLNWWAARTYDRAKFDLCEGMCMDQLWLNYAPVWVASTRFIGHPAWHFGLRSVTADRLTIENGHYQVQGQPLISVDFSGVAAFDPVWSDHSALLSFDKLYKKLYLEYIATVQNFTSMLDVKNSNVYGIASKISKNRGIRKNVAGKIKRIMQLIDQVPV